ncbi:MAG: hypothetical protein A2283_10715 [Lentisphaerae bacterium RIFOXYA12_FULL_48_11]|nr:MAG: hypothetical protein A2283_10715 [Lentisphaerae bacterium RIFOXYA12_FULL_48_11]
MNNSARVGFIWLSALVCLVAGIVMTIHNLKRSESIEERFRKQIGELKILRSQESDLNRHETARREYELVTDKKPVPLNTVLQETLAGVKVDDVRESRKELVDGWALRQKEISISDVPLDKVMDFVEKAESHKFPWSLARFVVRSAPLASGKGQVTLLMESLEKVE